MRRRPDLRTVLAALVALAALLVGVVVGAGFLRGSHDTEVGAPPSSQPAPEARYVAIAPCRIVDTRAGTGTGGTPFAPLATRTYYVGGTFGFAPQGGKSGGCGITVGATALAVTLTVVTPGGAGRVSAWPNGQTEPTATTYYYANHTGSSGATVSINASSAYALKVRNYSATTDLVIDVYGYYVKPLAAMVSPDGSLYSGSSRAIDSTALGTGVYRVTFDRRVADCTAAASVYATNFYASVDTYVNSAGDQVLVRVFDNAGTAAGQYVYLQIDC